jgi:PAS domain S-box-containing protein
MLSPPGANDGLWDWNLATNEIYFSPRWNHMLGYSGERNLVPTLNNGSATFMPTTGNRFAPRLRAHCEGKTPEFVSEYRMRHKSGGYIWTLSRGIAVRDHSGKALRMAGSQTDITEGKIADPLTHLPNRLYFIDLLESAIEIARQQDSRFAVLFVDLDQFKMVNDSLGHLAGDELLIDVAGRLRTSIRGSSRSGGPCTICRGAHRAETSSPSSSAISCTNPRPLLSRSESSKT